MAYRPHGHARVSASRPEAFAICDRCGGLYNHVDLSWQREYAGVGVINKRLLVCRTCLDPLTEQLRTIVLPSDPVPILNPRPGHGQTVGGYFDIAVSITIGGTTVEGPALVMAVIDADTFQIEAYTPASATATAAENGGNARIEFLLPSGLESSFIGTGYGQSGYGLGPYGVGGPSSDLHPARVWHLDNFGEDLIASPAGGAIYLWQPPIAEGNVATIIAEAPQQVTSLLVADQQQQIIALGCQVGDTAEFDPMLVRWCDAADYTDWTATVTNMAGSYRLPSGSRIVGGIVGPSCNYIWTDTTLYAMNFIGNSGGTNLVWGFTPIASGCGLICSRGAAGTPSSVLWMSQKEFMFVDSGGVHVMPCPVWDKVFGNLDTLQTEKITSAVNSMFGEAAWFYPSASGTGEVDSYVKVKLPSGQWGSQGPDLAALWDYGTLDRLSWINQSVFGAPMGVDAKGFIQQHETSPDAAGEPLQWFIESGYAAMSDGEVFTFVDALIPDFAASPGAQAQVTVYTKNMPTDTPRVSGPFGVYAGSQQINLRTRGRQIAFRISGGDRGSSVRLGAVRYRGAPDGRR